MNHTIIKIAAQHLDEFCQYIDSYYGAEFTKEEIHAATIQYINNPNTQFAADNTDHESIRNIIMNNRRQEPYSPYHTINS